MNIAHYYEQAADTLAGAEQERSLRAAQNALQQTSPAYMTPSKQCKAAGLKSLAELAKIVRKPPQTLRNWHKYSPELFATVVAGAVAIKRVVL